MTATTHDDLELLLEEAAEFGIELESPPQWSV